jgi:hypothetical protein
VCYQLCVLLYCTHAQIVVISMVVAFTNTRTKSKMGHDVDGICSRDKKTYFDRPMRNVELTIIVYMQL